MLYPLLELYRAALKLVTLPKPSQLRALVNTPPLSDWKLNCCSNAPRGVKVVSEREPGVGTAATAGSSVPITGKDHAGAVTAIERATALRLFAIMPNIVFDSRIMTRRSRP
jgi:hypothetical protein